MTTDMTVIAADATDGDGWTRLPAEPSLLHAVLDCLAVPVVLTTREAVVYLNRAAQNAITRGLTTLAIHGRRLDACAEPARVAIHQAVHAALQLGMHQLLELPAARERRTPQDTPSAEGPTSVGEMVAVVPLRFDPESKAAQDEVSRIALIMLARKEPCTDLVARLLCAHHHLTSAEADVLRDLLAGQAPREIARRKGVAISTVRTQITRIREKAKVGGIKELLSATAQLPPIASLVL